MDEKKGRTSFIEYKANVNEKIDRKNEGERKIQMIKRRSI